MPGKAHVGRLDAIETWLWSIQEPLMSLGSLPAEIPRSPQSYRQGFSPKLRKQTWIPRIPLPSLSYPKRIAFSESPLLSWNFLKLHISQFSVTVLNPISRWAPWHMPTSRMISVTLLFLLSEPWGTTVVWLWFLHVGGCGGVAFLHLLLFGDFILLPLTFFLLAHRVLNFFRLGQSLPPTFALTIAFCFDIPTIPHSEFGIICWSKTSSLCVDSLSALQACVMKIYNHPDCHLARISTFRK